ncbi:MAG: hypothetical protein ACUVXD_19440 [Thermodesulfobacteriota bacterium]
MEETEVSLQEIETTREIKALVQEHGLDLAKVRWQEYETGYWEGYEDGWERQKSGLGWPSDLMSRRDREAGIDLWMKRRAAQEAEQC